MTDDFSARLDSLIVEYLSVGCPCRFPRFRAVVGRDTSAQAGGSFTSDDQRGLIHAFDRNGRVVEKRPLEVYSEVQEGMWLAECATCRSALRRSYNEYSPGGTIDFLIVRLAPGVVDLGAPVEKGRILRCRPFVSPGSGMTGMKKAAQMSPFVEEDEWLTWMRERRDQSLEP